MRFLLNAARRQRVLTPKSSKLESDIGCDSLISEVRNIVALHQEKESTLHSKHNKNKVSEAINPPLHEEIKQQAQQDRINQNIWAQKCSPNCGCVVRFECATSGNNTVISSRYHAKSVLFHHTYNHDNNGNVTKEMKPLLTNHPHNPKPMFTPCNCKTLHKLSSSIAQSLPGKTMSQLRNETCGIRTDAFKYLVLRNMDLYPARQVKGEHEPNIESNERVNKCYDLVEEAYLSMVRGHSIAPRKSLSSTSSHLATDQRQIVDFALKTKRPQKAVALNNYDEGINQDDNGSSFPHGYAPARRRMLLSNRKNDGVNKIRMHHWKMTSKNARLRNRLKQKIFEDDNYWLKHVDEQNIIENETSSRHRSA